MSLPRIAPSPPDYLKHFKDDPCWARLLVVLMMRLPMILMALGGIGVGGGLVRGLGRLQGWW